MCIKKIRKEYAPLGNIKPSGFGATARKNYPLESLWAVFATPLRARREEYRLFWAVWLRLPLRGKQKEGQQLDFVCLPFGQLPKGLKAYSPKGNR